MIGLSHQPPSWWKSHPGWLGSLSRLDVLGVFSSEAGEYFRSELSGVQVLTLRHGVDADFFRPQESDLRGSGPLRVFFCGQWLRDFTMLKQVIVRVDERGIPGTVAFDLVVPPCDALETMRALAAKCNKHVSLHKELSNTALLSLYQACDLVFLPLVDCTACNSLLEAMAVGKRVLTTKVGGIPDYVSGAPVDLIAPGDCAGAVALLLEYAASPHKLRDPSQTDRARKHALQFDWRQTAGILTQIVGGG